jgi:hypothetical protein
MVRRTGWRAVVEWSLAFALLALVVASALSIGVFLLPVAIAAVVAAGVRNRAWPYLPFGLCIGVGAIVTALAFMHLGYVPCREMGRAIGAAASSPAVGRVSGGSCGGLNGRTWLPVGAILALVGIAGYVVLTRQGFWTRRSHG